MQRQIKFRAWDKEGKKMIYEEWDAGFSDYDIVISLEGKIYMPADHTTDCCDKHLGSEVGDFELMQYTGLKDKNGKEIYEGDIVILKIGHKYIVEYSQLNAWFCLVQVTDIDGHSIDKVYTGGIKGQEMRYCEVIGNIYENPELLKQ